MTSRVLYLVSPIEMRGKRVFMTWYIVYKGKPTHGSASLTENLEKAGIRYFQPMQITERLEGDKMVESTEPVLSNLIFIQTDADVRTVVREIDGLKAPYINLATRQPATVSDSELRRFRQVLEARNIHAEFLPDAYQRFDSCPRVRVKAGEFAGLEGRVFRIRHDRKLVISLDDMAVALSGIHHSLLEVIE